MPIPFRGTINIDIKDSTPELGAVHPAPRRPTAPRASSTSCSTTSASPRWSPGGGLIETPNINRLARRGLDVYELAHDRALLTDALEAC